MLSSNITNSNYSNILNQNDNTSIYPDDGYIIGYEVNIVLGFKYTACVLSLIGAFFIIFCYIFLSFLVKGKMNNRRESFSNNDSSDQENNKDENKKSEYKKLKMGFGHDLIFFLALSDFLLAISAFIKTSNFNSGKIDAACFAQGVIMNFAEMSSICWTSIIAYSIYLSTKTAGTSLIPKYYLFFLIFSYGFPIIFSIGPIFSQSYGPAGAWCWLNTKDLQNSTAWIWSLLIYLFNWINIGFNIFAVSKSLRYFSIRIFETKEENLDESNFLKNFCIVLKFFPIILVICWLPATVNRIYLFFSGIENTFLYTIHAFFSNLTGFLNCLVYSYYYKNFISLFVCSKLGFGKKRIDNNKDANHMEMEKIRAQMNNNNPNAYQKNVTLPSNDEKDQSKVNIDEL